MYICISSLYFDKDNSIDRFQDAYINIYLQCHKCLGLHLWEVVVECPWWWLLYIPGAGSSA